MRRRRARPTSRRAPRRFRSRARPARRSRPERRRASPGRARRGPLARAGRPGTRRTAPRLRRARSGRVMRVPVVVGVDRGLESREHLVGASVRRHAPVGRRLPARDPDRQERGAPGRRHAGPPGHGCRRRSPASPVACRSGRPGWVGFGSAAGSPSASRTSIPGSSRPGGTDGVCPPPCRAGRRSPRPVGARDPDLDTATALRAERLGVERGDGTAAG